MTIERRIEEILEKRARWGQLHREPVQLDEVVEIIHYFRKVVTGLQDQIEEQRNSADLSAADKIEELQAKLSEATGRVGGLQRRINKLERELEEAQK